MNRVIFTTLLFLCLGFFLLPSERTYAQIPSRQITLPLNPIIIQNGRYYLNGKPMPFDGLTFPMQAIDDPLTNRNIKTVLGLRTAKKVILLGLTVYLINLMADYNQFAYTNPRTPQLIFVGNVSVYYSLNISEIIFQRKAVRRYNEALLRYP